MIGFSCGKAIRSSPEPPPLVTDTARYVWHVQRAVTMYFQAEKDEFVISSYFVNRHTLDSSTVEYLPPNHYIPPHECTPRDQEHVVNHLLRAWERTDSEPSGLAHRLVYHSRPQDLVFDAREREQDEAQEWVERLVEAGVGQEVEDLRVARNLGAWQGRVACARYIRALAAEDLLDITEVLTPGECVAAASPLGSAHDSQPASPPPHSSPSIPPQDITTTPPVPPLPSRSPSPILLPPPMYPPQQGPIAPQHLASPAMPQRQSPEPWTPLATQSSPQSHHERGARRVNVFAGWGEGGKELTREITVPASQVRRPTPRRPLDIPPLQTIHQPRDAVRECEVNRGEEESAEVRDVVLDVAQSVGDREGEGATEGGWLGILGRAREALGRFVSAAPRTLRNPFSLFRSDPSGGHDPPD